MTDHDDLQDRLHALGSQPIDTARQSADLTAMASLRPASRLLPKLRVAAAFLAGLLIGGTGLAAANALPHQAQHVAHRALGSVGVDVPNPPRYWESECDGDETKNHGAYVSAATDKTDKKERAESDCGKPDKAAKAGAESDDADKPGKPDKPAKGACHGKPPWAENKALKGESKAAAQAERAAACPEDDEVEPSTLTEIDEDTDEDEDEDEDKDENDEDTTSTSTSTTTTTTG